MPPARPSPNVLRALSDETVVRALMDVPRITRAELAARTGLSKPTVAQSITRLAAAGLVADTGERTAARGGVGTYYALAPDAGRAIAVALAPEGVTAELIDVSGACRRRGRAEVRAPATPGRLREALRTAVRTAAAGGPVQVCVVSAADPVDRASGRLVHLPDAPFLIGDLDPVAALGPVVGGRVLVDNDVNWAARAERAARSPGLPRHDEASRAGVADEAGVTDGVGVADEAGGVDEVDEVGGGDRVGENGPDDFVQLYLGDGLGCAVVADGEVRRGRSGLAGEVAHVLTMGPDGLAVPFIEVFARLGLRREGLTAIDSDRLRARLAEPAGDELRAHLARAVAGVLAAAIGLCDPGLVVVGGPWGRAPGLVDEVRRVLAAGSRGVPVEPARLGEDAPLIGARAAALEQLRLDVVERSRRG